MKSRFLSVFALVLALASGFAHAGGREALDAFVKGLKGLEGNFTQETFDNKGRRKEQTTGRVALSVPRQFRWEYARPYPQLIVADGSKVWIYDEDLQQVTTRAQRNEEQNSPLTALFDPNRLDRDYQVRDGGVKDGLTWLELRPKKADGAGFQNARLGFGANGLARMSATDAAGQRTEIVFSGWKRNPVFPAQTFRFSPPKGVDVIGAD